MNKGPFLKLGLVVIFILTVLALSYVGNESREKGLLSKPEEPGVLEELIRSRQLKAEIISSEMKAEDLDSILDALYNAGFEVELSEATTSATTSATLIYHPIQSDIIPVVKEILSPYFKKILDKKDSKSDEKVLTLIAVPPQLGDIDRTAIKVFVVNGGHPEEKEASVAAYLKEVGFEKTSKIGVSGHDIEGIKLLYTLDKKLDAQLLKAVLGEKYGEVALEEIENPFGYDVMVIVGRE